MMRSIGLLSARRVSRMAWRVGTSRMAFGQLMTHLRTLTRNTMRVPLRASHRFTLHSRPTKLQEAAFKLLGIEPLRVQ